MEGGKMMEGGREGSEGLERYGYCMLNPDLATNTCYEPQPFDFFLLLPSLFLLFFSFLFSPPKPRGKTNTYGPSCLPQTSLPTFNSGPMKLQMTYRRNSESELHLQSGFSGQGC